MRDALHTAALALMLVPATAKAADAEAADRIDVTNLLYGETGRTQVVEPVVRFTHLFADNQSISAQFGVDVITGASPTGALPTGTVQTRTSASGRTVTSTAGEIPTAPFHDRRAVLEADWTKGWGRFVTSTVGGHYSRETDYQSSGISTKISTDLMHRLVTVTIGAGVDRDSVFPVGGTPDPLSNGVIVSHDSNPKNTTSLLFGVSRILSRQWMISATASRASESGYLTEPYKIVSVMNAVGVPVSSLNESRPDTRDRSSVLLGSVYHFSQDVLYTSYRYYWDTWNVRSHTLDVKYRYQVGTDTYLEPLVRLYTQNAASFYTAGLIQGHPLPQYASSDYRLGDLRTVTFGGTFGWRFDRYPGDWTVRAELIEQRGNSSPPNAIGIQRRFDLSPPVSIFALVFGYSFGY